MRRLIACADGTWNAPDQMDILDKLTGGAFGHKCTEDYRRRNLVEYVTRRV